MIEYQIQIRLHPEPSGGWSVSLPQLPGVASQGDTREKATANISEAFKAAAESYLESDGEIPWVSLEEIPWRDDADHDLFIVVEVEPPEIPSSPSRFGGLIMRTAPHATFERVSFAQRR